MGPEGVSVGGTLGYPLPNGFTTSSDTDEPLLSGTDGGYGLGQLTLAPPTREQQWNWHANLDESASRLLECYNRTQQHLLGLPGIENVTLTMENFYREAWAKYNGGLGTNYYSSISGNQLVKNPLLRRDVDAHVEACWANYGAQPWD